MCPEVIIAGSPVVYFEDSREGETTIKYDLTVHVPFFDTVQAGGSFKAFRIDYTAESPYGNDTPYSPVPGIDPFLLDTRFRSYQTGAYLQASKQVAARVNVTLGGRVDHYDILSQTRFSPRAASTCAGRDAVVEIERRLVLSAARVPLRVGVSRERVARALARRRLRDRPGLVAGASLRVTAEAYRKTYTDYPVASDLPTVSSPTSATPSPCARSCFRSRAPARATPKVWRCSSRSDSPRSSTVRATCRGRVRATPASTGCSGPARSTTHRVQPARRLSALASLGGLGPDVVALGPAVHADDEVVRLPSDAVGTPDTRLRGASADHGRVDIRVDRSFTWRQPLTALLEAERDQPPSFASDNWGRRTKASSSASSRASSDPGLRRSMPAAVAQDASAVVVAASKAMGMDNLNAIAYIGRARMGAFGQSKSIGDPMGTVNVTSVAEYRRVINFAKPDGMTVLVSRATGTTHPPTVPGGPLPTPGTLNQTITAAQAAGSWAQALNIWTTPSGFVKGAAANSSTVRRQGGQQIVSFSPRASRRPPARATPSLAFSIRAPLHHKGRDSR